MQPQMNHTNHQQDHIAHRLAQQSTSTGGSNVDHIQQQLRHLSFEKPNFQQSKDWQEGLRALLPNVNVSFGALPNNAGGFAGNSNLNGSQSDNQGHPNLDIEARFNHSQYQSGSSLTSNSAGNNHLLNDHSPHNMMNSIHQQPGQNISHQTQMNQHPNHMNHLNHHGQHPQQHMNLQPQPHNDRSQMQQHRSQHTGWGNMSGNDWTVLDPAIVSGQMSEHNLTQNGAPLGAMGNGPRSDSPPYWIKANLEQLTADTANISTNSAREYGSGQTPFNIGQLLSGQSSRGLGNLPSPNNTSNSNSAVQAALAGWSGQPSLLGHNTPPPGFMSRGSAASGLGGQTGPIPQQHPFQNMTNSNVGANDQIENEFQRLIHSKWNGLNFRYY